MTSLRTVASLILAVAILQLAQGMLSVFLPLAMVSDALSPAAVGAVSALYSLGFMAGAWFGPTLLARVGHIRVFAACAAIMAATTLAVHMATNVFGWSAARMATGVCVALMFAAVESWMASSVKSAERGRVIGFYMVCTKAVLALGPFLAGPGDGSSPEPLMLGAALIALAIAPICFTSQAQPEAPKAQPLALRQQFETAPAAVIAAFGAGFANTAVLTLAPLFAADVWGAQSAAPFQASAWIGSLIVQYPAGLLSDRVDRRLVIAWLCAIAAAAAIGLAVLGEAPPFVLAVCLFGLWGAGSLSFYGIAVAHMADRAEPGQMARATSGLLFIWAAGSVMGPLTVGAAADLFGAGSLFWVAGLAGLMLSAAMLTRRRVRAPSLPETKGPYAGAEQATSTASSDLAYGPADAEAAPRDPPPAARA
jgi:MFS family permease